MPSVDADAVPQDNGGMLPQAFQGAAPQTGTGDVQTLRLTKNEYLQCLYLFYLLDTWICLILSLTNRFIRHMFITFINVYLQWYLLWSVSCFRQSRVLVLLHVRVAWQSSLCWDRWKSEFIKVIESCASFEAECMLITWIRQRLFEIWSNCDLVYYMLLLKYISS